jgi:hypothetical protein
MKDFSFYEQSGIIIPGAVFLLGLIVLLPDLRSFFDQGGLTIGGFGVFVLCSYAAGHGVAALGNAIEVVWWKFQGGMPSNWVIGDKPRILHAEQIKRLQSQISTRLKIRGITLADIPRKEWAPIFLQIYRDVLRNNPGRAEVFNGNYGLCRGLGASLLLLAVLFFANTSHTYWIEVGLVGAALIYLIRMQRFGIHFAKETLNGFLNLPPEA